MTDLYDVSSPNMASHRTQNTLLIKRQRRFFLGTGYIAGLVAILSYVPSFIHSGALKLDPHFASRIRLWGLLVALFIVSGASSYVAFSAWRNGYVITDDRIIYRQSHRFDYVFRLSVSIITALLAPALLSALLFAGVKIV
jgi:hypothetical protein